MSGKITIYANNENVTTKRSVFMFTIPNDPLVIQHGYMQDCISIFFR